MDNIVSTLSDYLAIIVLTCAIIVATLFTLVVLVQGTHLLIHRINVRIIQTMLTYRRFSFIKKWTVELEERGILEMDKHYRAVVSARGAPKSPADAEAAESSAIELDDIASKVNTRAEPRQEGTQ